jgi:hypothetical protein
MSLRRLLPRGLPAGLERLTELAFELRWNTGDSVDELWHAVDPELWAMARNPVMILENISRTRFEALAGDDSFLQKLAVRVHACTVVSCSGVFADAPPESATEAPASAVTATRKAAFGASTPS